MVWAVLGLALWLVLAAASSWLWTAPRSGRPPLRRVGALLGVLVVQVVITAGVAWLGALAGPLDPPWSWAAVAVGAVAAVLSGGAVVLCVFALTDASAAPGTPRVQRTILRGGAWIGGLERLAVVGTLLAGWPDGILAILAVKAFARYPELKTGQGTGAIERFIIGTFTSMGWAALCAGVVVVMLR